MRITIDLKTGAIAKFAVGTAICAALIGTMTLSAATSAPGSADDPLVSKSYVESRINSALGAGGLTEAGRQSIVDEVVSRLEPLLSSKGGNAAFVPVRATIGQVLLGGEGTEIILRSGAAAVYLSGSEGLSDVTTGASLKNNETVMGNHLIIVPRADGRGMRVISGEAWFMVKGSHSINE